MTNKNMRVIAIVQARMGSSRLPGKVLKDICGKPMLWHIVSRIRKAEYVDDVVIACTLNKEDDRLEDFAASNNLGIYRGRVDDLVDRFYEAGKKFHADVVVRIWGDCPLVDPALIDKLLSEFIGGGYDHGNNFNPRTYPEGMNFEIYSAGTLERIWSETDDPFYREYPFEYIYSNPQSFKAIYDTNNTDLSDIHLTVDYIQDFQLVTDIYQNLYSEQKTFHLGEILEYLKTHPGFDETRQGLARNIEYNEAKGLREDKK